LSRFLLVAAMMAAFSSVAGADGDPNPPCQGAPVPAFPAAGQMTILSRGASQLGAGWVPPSCTGWREPGAKMLIAVSAGFTHGGGVDALLVRFGAVSAQRGIRYWSVTDAAWRPLILDAVALTGAQRSQKRADFSPQDLRSAAPLYFAERDGRSGEIVYRMQLLGSSPDGFTLAIENASPIRYLLFTLFGPGDMQSVYFVQRRAGNLWGYYSLTRAGAQSGALAGGHPESYMNRAQSLARHFLGQPTDSEPPAAR
jgi:hypothetical protein